MSKYTDQYVLYGYWDYGYAVNDVLATEADASISASATVTALGGKLKSFDGSVSGTATVSADSTVIGDTSASITAEATVSGDAVKVKPAASSVTATATAENSEITVVRNNSATINGIATFTGEPDVTMNGSASVSAFASTEGNYVNYGYWADGYAEGDIAFNQLPIRIRTSTSSVSGSASAENSEVLVIRNVIGNATGVATATASGGVEYSAYADCTGTATLYGLGGLIRNFYGTGYTDSVATARGYRLGEEWTDNAVSSDSWTEINGDSFLYVYPVYWENGYTTGDALDDNWTAIEVSSTDWTEITPDLTAVWTDKTIRNDVWQYQ
jgi:hypothetical protein